MSSICPSSVKVADTTSWEVIMEANIAKVGAVKFSPTGKYLGIWHPFFGEFSSVLCKRTVFSNALPSAFSRKKHAFFKLFYSEKLLKQLHNCNDIDWTIFDVNILFSLSINTR